MILLESGKRYINGREIPISRWEVWFMTPYGVTPNLEEARNRCVDMDPEMVITPIPVAIDTDGNWEPFFMRR